MGNGEHVARRKPLADAAHMIHRERTDWPREASSCSPFPIPRSRRIGRASPAAPSSIIPRKAGDEANASGALFYGSRGFTLLEMLAVIALIGIVAVAVITKVIPSFDKGKYKTGKIQLSTLSQDIDNYMLDNGSPPQQLVDLVKKPANAANWQGPYAKESQLKDPYGHDFGYQYPGQHAKYDLIFFGEDGKPGGDGLNADAGNWQ
jgi:general secretion pathway protein G